MSSPPKFQRNLGGQVKKTVSDVAQYSSMNLRFISSVGESSIRLAILLTL